MIQIKHIYQEIKEADGKRILVDRLWPRGISKDKAELDTWAKDIAPSKELRQWFHANTDKYDEFVVRYHQELDDNPLAVAFLDEIKKDAAEGNVTLITASSSERNNATALVEWIEK
jgi:uncharacterized protein YeaO (DUF488 family)